MIKRLIDILLSLIAILILSPLLIPVMVILKFTGEGYIFYKQERIGHHGEPFNLLKLATMFKNSPNMQGGNITTKNDPRILPFGKFLRKYKINGIYHIHPGHCLIYVLKYPESKFEVKWSILELCLPIQLKNLGFDLLTAGLKKTELNR